MTRRKQKRRDDVDPASVSRPSFPRARTVHADPLNHAPGDHPPSSRRPTSLLPGPALAVASLMIAGCGQANTPSTPFDGLRPPAPLRQIRAPGADVRFATPKNGSVQAHTFVARVTTTRFHRVRIGLEGQPRPGYGHFDFILDNGRYDEAKYTGANGKLATQLGVNGRYTPAYDPLTTYRNIPAGHHTLEVELVNTNGTTTGTESTVTFTIK